MVAEVKELYEGVKSPSSNESIKKPEFYMYAEKIQDLQRQAKAIGIKYLTQKPIRMEQLKSALQDVGILQIKKVK